MPLLGIINVIGAWRAGIILLILCIDQIDGLGTTYRAKRYGRYYSSSYYSNTGGVGWARYSRVYGSKPSLYTDYYNYMFDWFKTDDYKIYKSSPSASISVCKNYEADVNGTYLGIFTCPLPFVPSDYAYCCGVTNAEYCCTFWDVPLNFCAACIACLMGIGILITTCWIGLLLCIRVYKSSLMKKGRKKMRQVALFQRVGSLTMWNRIWSSPDPNAIVSVPSTPIEEYSD